MKRSLGALGLFFSAALVSGCPVYSNNVLPAECFYATDCAPGYRCAPGGYCVEAPPHGGSGADGGTADVASDAGDTASETGDAASESGDGASLDTVVDTAPRDASPEGSTDAPPAGDAGPVVFCGSPNDCAPVDTCGADGTCHRSNCLATPCINQFQCGITSSGPACVRASSKGCGADRHCLASERCIDGTCTAVAELCTDRSQCGAGKACADGRCTTTCTTDGQCAPGFLCRTALGICGAKARACLQTNDCGDPGQVCVDGGCVPRCGAVGACGAGGGAGICVDNGCVPGAKLAVECDGQGTQAGCAAGSICLHRHCYVSCAQDGGGCAAQSSTPVCKMVTVASASYAVCGTTETLGSECDITAARACAAGSTCIDGYCR
jgi:hypothetical protein